MVISISMPSVCPSIEECVFSCRRLEDAVVKDPASDEVLVSWQASPVTDRDFSTVRQCWCTRGTHAGHAFALMNDAASTMPVRARLILTSLRRLRVSLHPMMCLSQPWQDMKA